MRQGISSVGGVPGLRQLDSGATAAIESLPGGGAGAPGRVPANRVRRALRLPGQLVAVGSVRPARTRVDAAVAKRPGAASRGRRTPGCRDTRLRGRGAGLAAPARCLAAASAIARRPAGTGG
ncbi:hypothetical protein G6F65_020845 [Rhizopus arrhizus]|nr:hypothetical protein G6F65_020845 [Rhizopus arrhizus]